MKPRTGKLIAIVLAALLFMFAGSMVALRWFVNSGRLQTLLEARASEALNASVKISSLRLAWPLSLDIEGLEISAPGYEHSPLLTCPKIRITIRLWNLPRKHIESVTFVGMQINLVEDEHGGMNVPQIPSGEGSFSVGAIKIINGGVGIDLSAAEVSLKGILATLTDTPSSIKNEKVLRLNFDSAKASTRRQGERQIPLALKLFRSSFIIRGDELKSVIDAEMDTLLTTELPYLLLPPDIPVGLSFELDYLSSSDSLENALFSFKIPLFTNVSIYGSVKGLTGGKPVPNLNLTVQAPEIAELNEYNELFQRPTFREMKMSGDLNISAEIKGDFASPQISLQAGTNDGRFEWKGAVLEGLAIEMPVALDSGNIAVGPGRINSASAIIPMGNEKIEMTSLSTELSVDKSAVGLSNFKARIGNTAELLLEGNYEFDSGLLNGKGRLAKAPVMDIIATIPSSVYEFPEDLSMDGDLDLDCEIDGKVGSALENLSAKYAISLRRGEISSGNFLAVAGLTAELAGNLVTASPGELWKLDISGNAGNFELLVDTFYRNLSGRNFPINFSGEYAIGSKQLQNASASIDFGTIGKLEAEGTARFASTAQMAMRINSDKIDVQAVTEELGEEFMYEVSPLLKGAAAAGIVSGSIAISLEDERLETDGVLNLENGHLVLDRDAFSADSISAHLPFDIYFPQDEQSGPIRIRQEDYGRIALGNINFGPVSVPSLTLDVALKDNSLRVKGPIDLEILGGALRIGNIRGEKLLGPSASVTSSILVENIDMAQVTEKADLPKIKGALSANLSDITFTRNSLTTNGTANLDIFGGIVTAKSIAVDMPLSPVRTFKADLEFKDIDLLKVTNVLQFGSINGVMEGVLSGFELSQGQPASFVADFQTVERKGIPQRINFNAVENITILGTGQGFQAGIGRGLATFFKEFGYNKIGFYCTLKNDNFKIKGKVLEGGTEYFVRGVRIGPQINVINRSPDQTVSFKSMVERVGRIKKQKKKDLQ